MPNIFENLLGSLENERVQRAAQDRAESQRIAAETRSRVAGAMAPFEGEAAQQMLLPSQLARGLKTQEAQFEQQLPQEEKAFKRKYSYTEMAPDDPGARGLAAEAYKLETILGNKNQFSQYWAAWADEAEKAYQLLAQAKISGDPAAMKEAEQAVRDADEKRKNVPSKTDLWKHVLQLRQQLHEMRAGMQGGKPDHELLRQLQHNKERITRELSNEGTKIGGKYSIKGWTDDFMPILTTFLGDIPNIFNLRFDSPEKAKAYFNAILLASRTGKYNNMLKNMVESKLDKLIKNASTGWEGEEDPYVKKLKLVKAQTDTAGLLSFKDTIPKMLGKEIIPKIYPKRDFEHITNPYDRERAIEDGGVALFYLSGMQNAGFRKLVDVDLRKKIVGKNIELQKKYGEGPWTWIKSFVGTPELTPEEYKQQLQDKLRDKKDLLMFSASPVVMENYFRKNEPKTSPTVIKRRVKEIKNIMKGLYGEAGLSKPEQQTTVEANELWN